MYPPQHYINEPYSNANLEYITLSPQKTRKRKTNRSIFSDGGGGKGGLRISSNTIHILHCGKLPDQFFTLYMRTH